MFPPRSVPACVPSEPDGLGLSRSAAQAPQARLRRRAPLARIVEDTARAEGHYWRRRCIASSAVACTVNTPCQLHAAQKTQFGVTTTVTK